MNNVEDSVVERLEEFKKALDKYLHLLHGGRIDRERTLLIERIELSIQKLLRERGLCKPKMDLNHSLRHLLEYKELKEELYNYIKKLEEIEDFVYTTIDLDKGLEYFLKGDIDSPDAKIAAIIAQATARCIAENRLTKGIEDNLSPYCPVCGAESRTMVVRDDGYHMICPFCGFEWRISRDRPRCPWCGNDNPISIGVFTNKQRRLGLMVCQECGSTWRVILDRKIRAPNILLPLISLGAEAFRTFVRKDMTARKVQKEES